MNLNNIRNLLIFIVATIILVACDDWHNKCIPIHYRVSNVVPIHYTVSLNPQIKAEFHEGRLSKIINKCTFYGKSRTIISILDSTQTIGLYARNLYILSTSTKLIKSNGVIYNMTDIIIHQNFDLDLIELYFEHMLIPDVYILKMEWIGKIVNDDEEGFFKSFHVNKDGNISYMLATRNRAIGARHLFPCWDDLKWRTTFTFVIKHYRNFTALSNMPRYRIYRDRYVVDRMDFVWTYFHTTPPISTYHIAIVVTNYNFTRINRTIALWCRECSGKHSFEFAKNVIKYITPNVESEFEEIKIPKTDHVIIPNYPQDGTSKLGLIFYRELDLIYDSRFDTFMRQVEVARSIAHKIVYQWTGNTISPCWWSFHWLHDGLAELYGEDVVIKFFNKHFFTDMKDFFVVRNQFESLDLEFYFNMNPVHIDDAWDINKLFIFPRYIKVPIILRMIRISITDYVFRKAVRTYLNKYKFCSLPVDEFWYIQEDVANASRQLFNSRDFPFWLSYNNYPDLYWIQNDPSSGILRQQFGGWWIPTALVTKSFLPGIIELWLTPNKECYEMIHTAEDNWIMVDIREAGYYRIKYDEENWYKITQYLNSTDYKNISVINRAKLIDDLFYYTILERQLNLSIFLNLTVYLSQETDYAAWYPMIKILEYISSVFPVSVLSLNETYNIGRVFYPKEINAGFIKGKMRDLLAKSLKVLGFEKLPMESKLTETLRQEIAKWACILEHPKCLKIAKLKLEQHLSDPQTFKILPGWKKWTFCNGIKAVDPVTWKYTKEIWVDNVGDKYIEYISCFDPNIAYLLFPYLNYHKRARVITRKNQYNTVNVFFSLIVKHANTKYILDQILRKFWDIRPRIIKIHAALVLVINHVYSIERLNEVSIFVKLKEVDLRNLTTQASHKIEIRRSEIERQINYLQTNLQIKYPQTFTEEDELSNTTISETTGRTTLKIFDDDDIPDELFTW